MQNGRLTVAVVHTLPPIYSEWQSRLDRAVSTLYSREVDFIIITGGRGIHQGQSYNNPRLMLDYLLKNGVPIERIRWRNIADEEIETPVNSIDTGDEVGVALDLIQKNGWENALIRPISNWLHLIRTRIIYWWRARKRGLQLNLQPLSVPILLGLKWALLTEIAVCWPITLIDPGWTGRLVERRRAALRHSFGAQIK